MADIDPFLVPISERYFEDYLPGLVAEYGSITLTEPEIIEFARCFDPQYIHTDSERAAAGPYGGLIASGWHTSAVMMRLYVDHFLSQVATLGGPGCDELRWPAPVRPGDALRLRATVVEARVTKSRPDRGIIRVLTELRNTDDVLVFSATAVNFLRVRHA
ncbi:MAG: MaoC family dehydratase [Actinomycetota bacterium]|nr:MaoC family dehydratase [Actinomycetota bacterium]